MAGGSPPPAHQHRGGPAAGGPVGGPQPARPHLRRLAGHGDADVLLVPLAGGTAGEVEAGWHLHPDHSGNGYATEAASGAIARGLAAGLPEVLAVVRPDNAASQAVCRRLGMQARGLSERYYGTALEVFSTAPDVAAAPAPAR